MNQISKIKAFLNLDNSKLEIGELAINKNQIYFKYAPDFLESKLEISPFKLKKTSQILTPNEKHFDGLFGVFSDSIPDGWGKLLLDRKLSNAGINISEITALDRLAFIDKNSLGAITYEPDFENKFDFQNSVDLDIIYNQIENIFKEISVDDLEELFLLGGSSGGARPKINVGYNPKKNQIIANNSILPEGFEHWIIKFPATNDFADIASVEYVYNVMAKNCGIEVADFKLFTTKKGSVFFGTKRFDRIQNEKLHLHSVGGLLHDNYRLSTLDYGHIMDCAYKLEQDFLVYKKILKLATFNVLSHNRDDHSKNFSFLMDKNGKWKFAPAYDLTFSNASFGMHSTSVAGEYKNPSLKNLLQLARHYNVKNPKQIFDEVAASINEFSNLAKQFNINKETANLISKNINFMINQK